MLDDPRDEPQPLPVLDPSGAARLVRALRWSDHAETDAPTHQPPSVPGYIIDGTAVPLGHGAAGSVYRARREGSEHTLALKIFHQRLGSSSSMQRAWRELDLLSQLRLPCVPRLIDHGTVDGRLYFATELIEGEPPTQWCDSRDLTQSDRVELLARIADAVQSLHEHGVLHRDLKPSNIIVDATGQPLILDFGIATLLATTEAPSVTIEGSVIGTPAFMSPEQARGESHAVSTRSDVYGLGAMAYLLLTGQTPHPTDASGQDMIRRVTSLPPRDPRSIDPKIPRPLAAVLRKAVAIEPVDRYPSAAEFAAELRRWLTGQPVEAATLSIPQRVGRWVARHPVAMATLLAAMIVTTGVGTTVLLNWRYNTAPAFLDVEAVGGHAIVVRSRSGRELHRWMATHDDAYVVDARVIAMPRDLGGGRIALLALGRWDRLLAGRLTAFDLQQPSAPLWSAPSEPAAITMPPPISQQGPAPLTMVCALVRYGTMFPDRPTPQIFAAFTAEIFSATCIRVMQLDGEILYEVWHDGHVNDIVACSASGTLFVAGINSEGPLAQRGLAALAPLRNPPVVFALRPRLGERHAEWVRFDGGGGTYEPLWYRSIDPLDGLVAFEVPQFQLRFEAGADFDSRCGDTIRVSMTPSGSDEPGPGLFFTIDARTGTAHSVFGCDIYNERRLADPERWLPPSAFSLGEVPPAAPWPRPE